MEAWRILCQWLACDTVARAADMATYLSGFLLLLRPACPGSADAGIVQAPIGIYSCEASTDASLGAS